MADQPRDKKSIFFQAIEIESAAERAEFLSQACAGNDRLRAAVDALVEEHMQPQRLLDSSGLLATVDQSCAEKPGTVVGPYKLLEQIGEGGMGLVYMARQREPVKRNVALKLIKPGMDSKLVIARFEAERQALALMDHPNIARVLDAGSTESGRPYFVMDLVRGIPITDYCDRQRMPTDERLGLFISVCQAVQHAHQKGIIHRDVKPTNVLITLHDGTPVPKVIDFGIAKAVNRRLTEETLVTGFAQTVGTPSYMSPEQAALGGLDIDTRADVYSLGVLLYELLTGSTPFQDRLTDVSDEEFRRIVREEEPPKPSTRLTTLGESLDTVAEKRHTDQQTLSQQVRGELDWIVMKALEKDRTRRYETANDMALDVGRYLSGDPVEACPPSNTYRLRKAVLRNKAAVLTTLGVSLALVVGTAIAVGQAIRATNAERVAEQQVEVAKQQQRFAKRQGLLAQQQRKLAEQSRDRERQQRQAAEDHEKKADAERQRTEANVRLALEALDGVYLTISQERLPRKLHLDKTDQALLTKALLFYERFAQQNRGDVRLGLDTTKAYRRVGDIQAKLGQYGLAEQAQNHAIELLGKLMDDARDNVEYRRELAGSLTGLGAVLRTASRYQQAEQVLNRAVTIRRSLLAAPGDREAEYRDLAIALSETSELYRRMKRSSSEKLLLDEVVGIYQQLVEAGPESPEYRYGLADSQMNLGSLLGRSGALNQAESTYHRAMTVLEKLVDGFPNVVRYRAALARACNNRGVALSRGGRNQEAVEFFQKHIELYTEMLEQHPRVPRYREGLALGYGNLASAFNSLDEQTQAEEAGGQATDLFGKLADENPEIVVYQERLAAACQTHGDILTKDPERVQQAEALYKRQLTINTRLEKDSPRGDEPEVAGSENLDQVSGWLDAHDIDDESVAQDYRRNLASQRTVSDRFPDMSKYAVQHVDTYHRLAHALKAAGQLEKAQEHFRHGLRVFRGLPREARVQAARTMHVCESPVLVSLPKEPLFPGRPFFDGEHLIRLMNARGKPDAEHELHQELALGAYNTPPNIVHPGWKLAQIVILPGAVAAHYNPHDKRLYVGRSWGGGGGIFSVAADGTVRKVADSNGLASITVDPRNGDVFVSDLDSIYRLRYGGTKLETWVSAFKVGDSDPVGMAIAGDSYEGTFPDPGDGIVVDQGFQNRDEIYQLFTDRPEEEILLHTNADDGKGPLIDALDVTISNKAVYIADRWPGRIYRLEADRSLKLVSTKESLNAIGIAADPMSDQLFVADFQAGRVVTVNPVSGSVTNVVTGLTFGDGGPPRGACVDMTPDGTRLFITEWETGAILTLSRTTDASPFERGLLVAESGRARLAISEFTEAVHRDPRHALAFCERGFAYAEQGENEKAADDWATARTIDPTCALHYHYRGEVLCEEDKLDEAFAEFGKAIKLDAHLGRAYRGRAVVHAVRGEFDLVIREATEAIRLDPDDARAYAERAYAFEKSGQVEKAQGDWLKASQTNPGLADVYIRQGRALSLKDKWHEAVDQYSKALQIDPNSEPALSGRAEVWTRLERWAQAEQDLLKVIELGPPAAWPWHAVGVVRVAAGDHIAFRRGCSELLKRYAKTNPPVIPQWKLAWCCNMAPIADEDLELVLEFAEQAGPAKHEIAWARGVLDTVLFRTGRFEEGTANIVGRGGFNSIRLAMNHAGLGHFEEARTYLANAKPLVDEAIKERRWGVYTELELKLLQRKAQKLLQNLVQADNRALARSERGFAYAKQGDLDSAKVGWAAAVEIDPRCTIHYYLQGETLCVESKLDEAIEEYGKAIQLDSGFARAYRGRACVFAAQGKFDQAIREADEAIRLDPNDARAFAERGFAFAEMGEREKAEADWQEVRRINVRLADEYLDQGEAILFATQGPARFQPAVRAFTKAIQIDPEHAEAYQRRGDIHQKCGTYEEAVADHTAAFEHSADGDGTRPWALCRRANALRELGRYQESLKDCNQALRMPDVPPYVHDVRALVYVRLGQIDEAFAVWKKRQNAPANDRASIMIVKAFCDRGNQRLLIGQLEEAIADFTQAINIDAEHAPAYSGRGASLFRLGRVDESLADCDRACRVAPDNSYVALIRAEMLVIAERPERYRQACVNMLGCFAQSDNAGDLYHAARACSLAQNAVSDPMKPVELAKQALSKHSERCWFAYTLGMAHLRAGQVDEAIQYFHESLRLAPEWHARHLSWLGLALAHHQREQPKEARQWLEKAVTLIDENPASTIQGRLEGELLRREAERLVDALPPQD